MSTVPLKVNSVNLSSSIGLSSTAWLSLPGRSPLRPLGGASAALERAFCLRVGAVCSLPKKTCCQAGSLSGWPPGLGCSRSPYCRIWLLPTLEGVRQGWVCVWCRWTCWPGCFYCSTPCNPLVLSCLYVAQACPGPGFHHLQWYWASPAGLPPIRVVFTHTPATRVSGGSFSLQLNPRCFIFSGVS